MSNKDANKVKKSKTEIKKNINIEPVNVLNIPIEKESKTINIPIEKESKTKKQKEITTKQIELLEELKTILEVNDKENNFMSFTIETKKDIILNEYLNKVKEIYPSKVWLAGLNTEKIHRELCFIRQLLKHHGLTLASKLIKRKINGEDKKGIVYIITNDVEL